MEETYLALINGQLKPYDACGKRHDYDPKVFRWIGRGVIHSINGVLQNDEDRRYHFFVYTDDYEDLRDL